MLEHCRHCAALHTEEKEEESTTRPYKQCQRDISLQVLKVAVDGLGFAVLPSEVIERGTGQAFLSLVVRVHCCPLASLLCDFGGPACRTVAAEI